MQRISNVVRAIKRFVHHFFKKREKQQSDDKEKGFGIQGIDMFY